MTPDLLNVLGFWFGWSFMFWQNFKIPGTNVTGAGMLLFTASAIIGIRFLKKMFGDDDEN